MVRPVVRSAVRSAVASVEDKYGSFSWSSYWTQLISATVEDAEPTHVVLTFPTAKTSLGASDFTIAGFTINSASWAGSVLTLVLSTAVVYGDVLVVTFVRTGQTHAVTNNVEAEAESLALFARMTIAAPIALKRLINITIKAYKADGTWAENDVIYQTNLHTLQASCLNLKGDDAFNLVPEGNYTWAYGVGFTMGSTSYLKTGFIPSTHGSKYLLDSASIALGIANNIAVNAVDFGSNHADDSKKTNMVSLGWGVFYMGINTAAIDSKANASSLGYFTIMRSASNVTQAYKDGVALGTPATRVSTAVSDYEFYIGCTNSEGTPGTRAVGRIYNSIKIGGIYDVSLDHAATSYFNANVASCITFWDTLPANQNSWSDNSTQELLTLTTPDGFGETVQPCVVDHGSDWNGYRYWMTDTPYHLSDDQYERPCVWASADGVTWVVPAGGSNPVMDEQKHADPSLFFDNDILYLTYIKANGGADHLKVGMKYTSDGINWSAEIIIATPSVDNTTHECPSLTKVGSTYYLYYTVEVPDSTNVRRKSCATIDGLYTNYEVVNMAPYLGDFDYLWYHINIFKVGNYHWLFASIKKASTSGIQLFAFIGKSSDGINFVRNPDAIPSLNSIWGNVYRASVVNIGSQIVFYWGGSYMNPGLTWRIRKVNGALRP
jgi:hypothetical protein